MPGLRVKSSGSRRRRHVSFPKEAGQESKKVPSGGLWFQFFAPITDMSLPKRMRGETHMRRMSLMVPRMSRACAAHMSFRRRIYMRNNLSKVGSDRTRDRGFGVRNVDRARDGIDARPVGRCDAEQCWNGRQYQAKGATNRST